MRDISLPLPLLSVLDIILPLPPSLPGVCVVAGLAGLPDPGTGEAAAMLAELQLS